MVSWQFLLIGSFAAVGAAMALGTLAAMANYRRTGIFPGQDEASTPTRGQIIGLWVRIVIGLVLAGAGVASLVVNDLI